MSTLFPIPHTPVVRINRRLHLAVEAGRVRLEDPVLARDLDLLARFLSAAPRQSA
ncbi:hypothetical protein [Peterkaempfera griseoplana]|uniref:hypothetical protein n=1 Tax=Peterkaempfera griseoplana TaxID=66896 RepID=UPI0012FEB55E|nr:hypothetical protein [Peterkaempfera griseoplana]